MRDFEQWRSWFKNNRQPELASFYLQLLPDEQETVHLIEQCRDRETDRRPLRILNAIERLGRLSEDITRLESASDPLSLLLLVVCIETIYSIGEVGPNKKVDIVIDFFANHLTGPDCATLLSRIRRSRGDSSWQPNKSEALKPEAVARVINEVRNLFAHEGESSLFSFPKPGNGILLVGPISVDETGNGNKVEHCYDVSITLDQFRQIVLRGCIHFLRHVLGG